MRELQGYMFSILNYGFVRRNLRAIGAFIALAILFLLAWVRYPHFRTLENLTNVLRQGSMLGVMAVGMTFVIIAGGIDLSVGSILAVSGIVAATTSSLFPAIPIVLAVLTGTFMGFINGIVVSKMKIVPFIATLAMMLAGRGASFLLTNEKPVAVDRAMTSFLRIGRGFFLGVPIPTIIFIVVVVSAIIVLRHSPFGRQVFAVGGSEEASRMMGLKVDTIKMCVFMLSGAFSGLASVILTARLGAAQTTAGHGWEMEAIAAVAIGGTLTTGGIGSVEGTFAGVMIVGLVSNMINLQGNITTHWQSVITGTLLLIVIVVQSVTSKKRLF